MVSRRRFLFSAAATAPALALRAQTPTETAPQTTTDLPAPALAIPPCEEPPLPAPILALKDRSKDIVPITVDERNDRLDLARDLMKQYGLNAILVTTGGSLRYYTGAVWPQSERLFAYVIPQSAAPFIVCPWFERDHLADVLLQFPERESTISYLWQESDDPYIILRRALAEAGVTTGTLGLEENVPYGMANMIAMAAPALKIVSATPVTAGQRSLKSAAEIALMRLASQITFDVYKAVYLACAPGDTNQRFTYLAGKAYERCGVHGEVACNVAAATASPDGSEQQQFIREGDMVVINGGCTSDGYWSDLTRSFVYGQPTDQQREVFEIVRDAQSAALAAAHPGFAMQVVDTAARKLIQQAGYGPEYAFFTHRLGHGIGLDRHEWPYLVGGNPEKLMPSMVFSNGPGMYLPQKFGVRLEDDMLITDKGAELFTWQSPSLLDPFAIPDQRKAKVGEASAPADTTTPPATTPAATSAPAPATTPQAAPAAANPAPAAAGANKPISLTPPQTPPQP